MRQWFCDTCEKTVYGQHLCAGKDRDQVSFQQMQFSHLRRCQQSYDVYVTCSNCGRPPFWDNLPFGSRVTDKACGVCGCKTLRLADRVTL